MKTKIFFGNQYVEKFNCDGRKVTKLQAIIQKITRMTKRVTLVLFGMCVIGWSWYAGAQLMPRTVYADHQTIVTVEASTTAPVLQRIAKCESGDSQYDKNGQVLLHVNNDKSVDEGKFQINLQTWGAVASKMGYDLTRESDNEAFAKWLYENKGTQDWSASFSCWNR